MSYLKVTAGELLNVSGQLGTAAGNIAEENGRAMTQVTGLVGAGWEGAASEQFNALFTQWKTGADQVQEALHGISQLLSNAGNAYQRTEDHVKSSMTQ
jgi:WXG100 family type VII secretion target